MTTDRLAHHVGDLATRLENALTALRILETQQQLGEPVDVGLLRRPLERAADHAHGLLGELAELTRTIGSTTECDVTCGPARSTA